MAGNVEAATATARLLKSTNFQPDRAARRAVGGVRVRSIQSLWAGYGTVYAVEEDGEACDVLKHIQPPADDDSIGARRKRDSYVVEAAFYSQGAAETLLAQGLVVPAPRGCWFLRDGQVLAHGDESFDTLFIGMSHLGSATPHVAYGELSMQQLETATHFFAGLHGAWWGAEASAVAVKKLGLAPRGAYWYLGTRPDEWEAIPSHPAWMHALKEHAADIDRELAASPFQCIVHGDAKTANMLWNADNTVVGMCDFQYVGRNVPTTDIAKLLACSAPASVLETDEALDAYLGMYWGALSDVVGADVLESHGFDAAALRDLFDLSLLDLVRFLAGWGWWGNTECLCARAERAVRARGW